MNPIGNKIRVIGGFNVFSPKQLHLILGGKLVALTTILPKAHHFLLTSFFLSRLPFYSIKV